MPDVVNIMLLKISLRNFESQEKLLQIGPEIFLIMNHHGTHYCVDVKAGACIVSTLDEVRRKELRDNNIFYQEGLPYLIPAVGSSRALEGALEACDTTYGHLPAHYYQPRTPMILCNYYRAWILGNSIMALIFATFSPKGTQDIKLIANINEPFPTGAKQRDQTDCGNLPSHYIEISRRKKQSTQVSMIQRWVGGSFLEARHSSVDYDFGSDLYSDSGLKLNSGSGILHSTILATQARQPDNPSLEDRHASQSHVLEPYFHPEITEVGTLPSLGAMRATCVANILMNHHGTHYYVDVKAGACILSTHDEVRWKEPRDNNIFYQEGLPYLIPAVGSSRALEGALEACDTTYGHLPAHYYQPRTPMILCNYYRAWILGNSIMALIFATFSPKGTQDIKLIANINEPFPTGAKQRDQTDCGNLPSHYIEISRRKKQSTQVSMIQRWVGGSFLEARHSSVDYDFGSDLYSDSGLKLNSGSGILHSTILATQARQPDNPSLEDRHASQSHVLEPYFHPEITEVGTLPSLGAVRVTCVGNIQISDGVGQKRRDFEEMACSAFLQGYRRDFTAVSHWDIIYLQNFCLIVTDGECSTPAEIAAEYSNRVLIIHSRKPASAERWKRHHLLRRSPHLLVEVTLVSRQKDLLVV